MSADIKDTPILLIDIAGFSRLKTDPEQRAILLRLEAILVAVLGKFSGFTDPLKAYDWQSTGDGYFITLKGCPSPVAMRVAVDLEQALLADNARQPDYPLRLRVGLVLGDVQPVGQHHQMSAAKTEITRLVDHKWTRVVLEKREKSNGPPLVVVAATLFKSNWDNHSMRNRAGLEIPPNVVWSRAEFVIKHGETLTGYIQEADDVMQRIIRENPVTDSIPDVGLVDLDPWLATVLDRTGKLEIRGIGSGAGRNKDAGRYDIETLYTPLRSRGEAEVEGNRKNNDLALERGGEPVSLASALATQNRLLIEGQPGAGKTTFIKLAAAMLCRDLLEVPCPEGRSWRGKYLGLPNEAPPLVPLFLRLSELVELLAKDEKPFPADDGRRLLELLDSTVKPDNPPAWRKRWEGLLERGEAMLLLDGLDEVADEKIRRRVIAMVQEALRRWPKCPMVVSSRPFGVEQMRGMGFHHVVIEPFTMEEIKTFIQQWSAALHGDALSLGIGENHQEILLQAIGEKPEIRRLAANPVMLTCLCVVHWNEGRLPEGRARVYQAVLRWLIAARSVMRSEAGYQDRFAEEALAELALAMMTVDAGKKVALFDFQVGAEAVEQRVQRHFTRLTTKPERLKLGKAWLAFECLGSGIVEEIGAQKLKFWHLTFQEYLAALSLAWLGDEEVAGEDFWPVIKDHLADPQWRETVELFPGALFDEGGGRRVDRLLQRVLASAGQSPTLADEARVAGVMGRLLQPMTAYQYNPPPATERQYHVLRERAMAIFTREGAAKVPVQDRIGAAEALGLGGDPRLVRENFAKPEYLIEVPGTGWRLRKFLVTVQEYQEFVEQDGYREGKWWDAAGWTLRMAKKWENPGGWDEQTLHPNRPVTRVSWYEAMAYCRWLSAQLVRLTIRLPTETLWQQAATPTQGDYPWGAADPSPELANFVRNVNTPSPVGLYPAGDGPFGHCDLAGNVWEWQRTPYQEKRPIAEETPLDPNTGGDNNGFVLRGGSWVNSAGGLRSAVHGRSLAGNRDVNVGVRVAAAPASP